MLGLLSETPHPASDGVIDGTVAPARRHPPMTSPAVERLTEVQNKIVEAVASFQDPVVDTVRKGVDLVEERIPEFPTEKVTAKLPTAREVVENQYEFATRMLKVSHDFTLAVIGALEPVTDKVVKAEPAKPKTATRKAA